MSSSARSQPYSFHASRHSTPYPRTILSAVLHRYYVDREHDLQKISDRYHEVYGLRIDTSLIKGLLGHDGSCITPRMALGEMCPDEWMIKARMRLMDFIVKEGETEQDELEIAEKCADEWNGQMTVEFVRSLLAFTKGKPWVNEYYL